MLRSVERLCDKTDTDALAAYVLVACIQLCVRVADPNSAAVDLWKSSPTYGLLLYWSVSPYGSISILTAEVTTI